jgi:hypothetical protein
MFFLRSNSAASSSPNIRKSDKERALASTSPSRLASWILASCRRKPPPMPAEWFRSRNALRIVDHAPQIYPHSCGTAARAAKFGVAAFFISFCHLIVYSFLAPRSSFMYNTALTPCVVWYILIQCRIGSTDCDSRNTFSGYNSLYPPAQIVDIVKNKSWPEAHLSRSRSLPLATSSSSS